MGRHKKQPSPLLQIAREHLRLSASPASKARLQLHQLDGPPGSPRFAVTAEACQAVHCPYGIDQATARAGNCPVPQCDERCTVRMLFNRDGTILAETHSGVHWSADAAQANDESG